MRTTIKRALVSVYDKTFLPEFAAGLADLGVELVSSASTAAAIEAAGLPVTRVEDVTGMPEMLDERVKTLHPNIHGGLLADRGKDSHLADLERHQIAPFDLVVSNLYPFLERPGIDTIDIGGPAMVRAAAKNHAWVTVVTSPAQYEPLLAELRTHDGTVSEPTRRALALEAFAHTAAYDAAIVQWLQEGASLPRHLMLALERTDETLRYGENPHQQGARYRRRGTTSWWDNVTQHGGLALSYLNFYDTDAAWKLVHDLGDGPACAIIKHANPCGAAVAGTSSDAYQRALECDERSAFGGIVALNRPIDTETVARMVDGPQADVVIAPGYEGDAIAALQQRRRNTRLLEASPPGAESLDFRQLSGGFLVQSPHAFVAGRNDWRVVTKVAPTAEQWRDLELAWRICGHVKSNAIVLVKDGQAVGIGAGQQNRVESGEIAARKAAGRAAGGACASDAFYPFPDGVEAAAAAGVAAVIQPGGGRGDETVIETADELGLAMVFTGERHFFPLMAATLLDGNALLDHVKSDLRARVKALGERGVTPGLGTILVGDDPNSAAYIRGKRADSADVGIESFHVELPGSATRADVHAAIDDFNDDPRVDAFLVQLPLPGDLDDQDALDAIDPTKDADGLHPVNLGRLMLGVAGARPCTPLGIQALLVHNRVPIEGHHVVIVGRGLTIGRPLAVLLSLKEPNANATVTHCHTGTKFLPELTRQADILIAAAGSPNIVRPDMVKPGAAVVGAGITMEGRRIVPDVDEECAAVAGWITPRIGGVGPTTRAMLLRNTVDAAEQALHPS